MDAISVTVMKVTEMAAVHRDQLFLLYVPYARRAVKAACE